jgi:hypothetical protein
MIAGKREKSQNYIEILSYTSQNGNHQGNNIKCWGQGGDLYIWLVGM